MSATTLWKLVLTHPEPQVPEALRAPALAHLASVLDRPVEALEARLAEGATLAPCARCGFPSSADICGVCRIKDAVAGD